MINYQINTTLTGIKIPLKSPNKLYLFLTSTQYETLPVEHCENFT